MDIRNEICLKLALFGVEAEVHHHEVGTAGQCEIAVAATMRLNAATAIKY